MCANKQKEKVGIPKGPTCSTGSTARALQVQLRPGDKREGKKGEREREREGRNRARKWRSPSSAAVSTSAPLCHFDPTPLLCCVVVCHCTDRPGPPPPPPFIHSLTASLPNTFRLCETGPAYPECESGVHSTSFLQSQQRAIFSPPNIAEWTPTSCQKISMVTPPLELQDFPSPSHPKRAKPSSLAREVRIEDARSVSERQIRWKEKKARWTLRADSQSPGGRVVWLRREGEGCQPVTSPI